MTKIRRTLLVNSTLAIALFGVSWLLIAGLWAIDSILLGRAEAPVDPEHIRSETELAGFVERLSQLGEAHQRWKTYYLPVITVVIAVGAGRFSVAWSWTWMVLLIGLSPVLVMVAAANSAASGLGLLVVVLHFALAAAVGTLFAWFRARQTLTAKER